MKKMLKNGLLLNTIDLPVPILRHPKWVEIKYPKKLSETELISLIKKSVPQIEEFAKKNYLKQVKVATNPFWEKLDKANLTRTVYYVTNNSLNLATISSKAYQITEIQSPEEIKNLIQDQFVYHYQLKPIYYTGNIIARVPWFIDLVKEAVKRGRGFLLKASYDKEPVGFLYGEREENGGCIDELFVSKKFRNKGFGKTLVRKAGEIFHSKNLDEIGLFIDVNNKALGFYEKLGFKKESANWIRNLD